jgi:hypothetical protein
METAYQFKPSPRYPNRMETSRVRVTYFVQPDFRKKFARNQAELMRVEQEVEEDYHRFTYRQCEQDKRTKDRYLAEIRWHHSESERERLRLVSISEICHSLD